MVRKGQQWKKAEQKQGKRELSKPLEAKAKMRARLVMGICLELNEEIFQRWENLKSDLSNLNTNTVF